MQTTRRTAGGTVIDDAKFDYHLSLRALSRREFARRAGLSEPALCHILAGRAVRPSTLKKIVDALVAAPVLPGVELIVAAPASSPEKETAAAIASAAVKEVSGGTRATSATS